MSIDPPINRLKRALRGGDVQIGLWSCLASAVATEVVAGSGFEFVDRGEHELKGVPDTWRVYAVADG